MSDETISDVLTRLQNGKRELRERRRSMSLPEKVREVIRLQAATLPMIRRRRELRPWERVWPLD